MKYQCNQGEGFLLFPPLSQAYNHFLSLIDLNFDLHSFHPSLLHTGPMLTNVLKTHSSFPLPPPGLTPLHVAANSGSFDVLRQLCAARPDVDIQDIKSGKTALHYAVEREELPMTGYLVTEVGGMSHLMCQCALPCILAAVVNCSR